MAKKPLIYLIYDDLVKALSGTAKKVYLNDRPDNVSESLTDFIVIDLSTSLQPMLKGNLEVLSDCFGSINVFCKAKSDSTLNVNVQSKLVQGVFDKFPINGTYVSATRPTILMRGADGYGYQVTTITFSLRTKFNARNLK